MPVPCEKQKRCCQCNKQAEGESEEKSQECYCDWTQIGGGPVHAETLIICKPQKQKTATASARSDSPQHEGGQTKPPPTELLL